MERCGRAVGVTALCCGYPSAGCFRPFSARLRCFLSAADTVKPRRAYRAGGCRGIAACSPIPGSAQGPGQPDDGAGIGAGTRPLCVHQLSASRRHLEIGGLGAAPGGQSRRLLCVAGIAPDLLAAPAPAGRTEQANIAGLTSQIERRSAAQPWSRCRAQPAPGRPTWLSSQLTTRLGPVIG